MQKAAGTSEEKRGSAVFMHRSVQRKKIWNKQYITLDNSCILLYTVYKEER